MGGVQGRISGVASPSGVLWGYVGTGGHEGCELPFVAGGILAGIVSDYTSGRATTCTVMLLLAAPLV